MSIDDLTNELNRVANTAPQSEQCIAEYDAVQQRYEESERFLAALRRNADKEEGKLATLKNVSQSVYILHSFSLSIVSLELLFSLYIYSTENLFTKREIVC